MKRPDAFLIMFLLLLAGFTPGDLPIRPGDGGPSAAVPRKPNVIIILADQWRA